MSWPPEDPHYSEDPDPQDWEIDRDPDLPRKRHPSHIWAEPNDFFRPHNRGARCAACGAAYCRTCPPELYRAAYLECVPHDEEPESAMEILRGHH